MTSFGLLLASWVMPLHFPPWVSWHNEILAFASALVMALAFLLTLRRAGALGRVEIPAASIPLIGLGGVALVQATTGLLTFWGDALVIVSYLALCLVSLALGFTWGRASGTVTQTATGKKIDDLLQAMAWTLLAGATVSGLIAFVQVFEVWGDVSWILRMPELRRPGANLGQPNQLATLLLMGIASLLYLREQGKISVSTSLLCFIVISVALAATESRTGVLSFLVLAAWWLSGRFRSGLKLSPWAVSLAVVWFISMFLAWPTLMSSAETFAPGAEVNAQPGMRLVVWPQLLEAILLRPWAGWGLREVSEAHNAVASNYLVSEPYTYSHNIVLDLALGVGLPLALLIVLAVFVWLVRRVRSARTPTTWYCLAAVLPVAVHSMLEFPFAYAYFLVPALFLVGVLEARCGVKPLIALTPKPVAAALVLMTALGGWSVVEYLRIEEDFRIARFEALRVGRTPSDYQRPTVRLLTQLDALLTGARVVPRPGMSAEQLELSRRVALRFPWPATQNRYALSLALNGNTPEALRQLKVLRALHGEAVYASIKENWQVLGQTEFQELNRLVLP